MKKLALAFVLLPLLMKAVASDRLHLANFAFNKRWMIVHSNDLWRAYDSSAHILPTYSLINKFSLFLAGNPVSDDIRNDFYNNQVSRWYSIIWRSIPPMGVLFMRIAEPGINRFVSVKSAIIFSLKHKTLI
jgi:hypothetical protein